MCIFLSLRFSLISRAYVNKTMHFPLYHALVRSFYVLINLLINSVSYMAAEATVVFGTICKKIHFSKLKGKKCLLFIAIRERMNEWIRNQWCFFWIRAKKATRKRHSHPTYVENVWHTWNRSNPIQFNPIELNYVYRYSCKSVQFAALHIPVAHTSHL